MKRFLIDDNVNTVKAPNPAGKCAAGLGGAKTG